MHKIVCTPIGDLKPNKRNARTHPKKQIREIANSILQFGFLVPIVADENGVVLLGHARREAALSLGLTEVPVITVTGLSDARKRALMLADNKIASKAGWDREMLAVELPELMPLLEAEGLEIALTGFEVPEIDALVADFTEDGNDPDDQIEDPSGPAVSRPGDLWCLGRHRLLCGNARSEVDLDRLMDGKKAAMAFLDAPYNIAVSTVVGRGKTKHREFSEASGNESEEEFIAFLKATLGNAVRVSADGSLHYICMDWRQDYALQSVARQIYAQHVNTAVWIKTNAGMGSFYRSQYEKIYVHRVGNTSHRNNVDLGKHGRSRTNVWTYPGSNTFRKGRMDDLRAHPTVKPVALVSDAMLDCTRRGDIVIDLFCGSGTAVLAAERVGRRAYCMEIDPLYVDTAVRRWQALTRKDAILAGTSSTFEEAEGNRKADCASVE
jgi:DNA modification methylase